MKNSKFTNNSTVDAPRSTVMNEFLFLKCRLLDRGLFFEHSIELWIRSVAVVFIRVVENWIQPLVSGQVALVN